MRWMPLLLVGLVLAIDAVQAHLAFETWRSGALDEVGHVATTACVLTAVAPRWARRHPRLVLIALAATVLIDLDHLPLALTLDSSQVADVDRPVTHSLTTPVLLTVAAWSFRPARRLLLLAAVGVALHLVRDLATGPGIPLGWPITRSSVAVPYAPYAIALVSVAIWAALGDRSGADRDLRQVDRPRVRGRSIPDLRDISKSSKRRLTIWR